MRCNYHKHCWFAARKGCWTVKIFPQQPVNVFLRDVWQPMLIVKNKHGLSNISVKSAKYWGENLAFCLFCLPGLFFIQKGLQFTLGMPEASKPVGIAEARSLQARCCPVSQPTVSKLREAVMSSKVNPTTANDFVHRHHHWTQLITVGDRAFPVAWSRLRNSLPHVVTSAPTLAVSGIDSKPACSLVRSCIHHLVV